MRKVTRVVLFSMIFASPAVIAAQDMPDGQAMPSGMQEPTVEAVPAKTPEQQLQYDSWPVEQQAMYDGWPDSYQAYYWTLQPEQQDVYWRLSDQNRADLDALDEPGRMAAWDAIKAQLNGMPAEAAPQGELVEDMPSHADPEPIPDTAKPAEPR